MLAQHAFHRQQPRRLGIGRQLQLQGLLVGQSRRGGIGVVHQHLVAPLPQCCLRLRQIAFRQPIHRYLCFAQGGGKIGIERIVGRAHQHNMAVDVRIGIAAERHRHNQHKRHRQHKQHRQAVQVVAEQFQFFNQRGQNHGVCRCKKSR